MKEKNTDNKEKKNSPVPSQSEYLGAGRTIYFDSSRQGSENSDASDIRTFGELDPNASTLGNDISLNCVTFESKGFDYIQQ